MPLVKLSPVFNSQIVDENGAPAVGWKIYAYVAGSSTPLDTYTNSTGATPQSNPIILNALGFPTMEQLWLQAGRSYKLQLTDENDVVKKTEDNISGVNDTATATDEWTDSGLTPTYVTAGSFTISGDQTSQFHIGRRLKFQVTAGPVNGRITGSSYNGSLTTVTVQMDGAQALDVGLSLVQLSILRNNVLSVPYRIGTTTGTDAYAAAVGAARYVIGDEYKIKVVNSNLTTSPTLNLDSIGAIPILLGTGAAPPVGALNGEHTFRYNGTSMIVLNPATTGAIRGYISGLNMSTPGTSTNMSVATGQAADNGSVTLINLLAAITKTTGAWAVGTGNGGLDEGTIAASLLYYFFLIRRPDTAVVDVLYSQSPGIAGTATVTIATPAVVTWSAHGLQAGAGFVFSTTGTLPTGIVAGTRYYVSATGLTADAFQLSATKGGASINTTGTQSGVHTITSAPVLPANYTQYRYIGGNPTTAATQWTKVTQNGDDFDLALPALDLNAAGVASATLLACSIPRGRKMRVRFNGYVNNGANGMYISDPANNDLAPDAGATNPLSSIQAGASSVSAQISCWTDTGGRIRHREISTGIVALATLGWTDLRDRT